MGGYAPQRSPSYFVPTRALNFSNLKKTPGGNFASTRRYYIAYNETYLRRRYEELRIWQVHGRRYPDHPHGTGLAGVDLHSRNA